MFSSQDQKSLNRIVEESSSHAERAWCAYTEALRRSWAGVQRAAGHSKVIQHVTNHLGGRLTLAEGRRLDGLLEGYRAGRVLRSVLVAGLRGSALKCGLDQLAAQAYLNPYPAGLDEAGC